MQADPHSGLILSSLSVEDIAAHVGRPLADTLLSSIPEAVRRGRLGQYLTDEQAQEETGLNKRQLRYLREKRRISYSVVGKTVLYPTGDLFRYIDAGLIPTRDAVPA